MEEKFLEAVDYALEQWDTDPDPSMPRHESVGLTLEELERFEEFREWPDETTPLLCMGVLFALQPAWVRGEVPVWFEAVHTDTQGNPVARIRGAKDFVLKVQGELLWREYAHGKFEEEWKGLLKNEN